MIEVTSPRLMLAADHLTTELVQNTPALWPGLEYRGTGINGHVTIHYVASYGTDTAEHITRDGGVLATWQAKLRNSGLPQVEIRGSDRVHTLTGSLDGTPITVIASIAGVGPMAGGAP